MSQQEAGMAERSSLGTYGGEMQFVGCQVGREEYGFDILQVKEVIRLPELTRVPNLPEFVEGVINLRGCVIPVVALRRCFGLDRSEHNKHSRVVVIELKGAVFGFVVDAVSEVLRVSQKTVEPPPRLGRTKREYVSGIGKLDGRLLLVLDLDRLLTHTEQAAYRKAARAN
jgi:purine-binding chemotaxis protein CheW